MLALVRPDDWNLPLFVHVLGAFALIGALLLVAAALLRAWKAGGDDANALQQLGFRALLLLVVPSYVVMRIGAQWVESRENFAEDNEPGWLGVGYVTADAGALLILVSIVLAAIGLRRPGRVPERVVGVIAALLLAAYVVAVWAMTAKPGA
jgi:hypothetical protein